MDKYITSNLVMENTYIEKIRLSEQNRKKSGSIYSEEKRGSCSICRLEISNKEQEREYNCKMGRYTTVYTPKLCSVDNKLSDELSSVIAKEIADAISDALASPILPSMSFLIAGIGNRQITPDCIGPFTVEKINVTRHVKLIDPLAFTTLGICSVCAVSCGVMGETGMETAELLQALTDKLSPTAIIAIDALAAKDCERLAATVQISDAGISPGAGIGNRQALINKENLGVPVIAVGVPTVVSAATVIGDALKKAKYGKLNGELEKILDRGRSFFVAPKECDLIAQSVSEILALSIDKALGVI